MIQVIGTKRLLLPIMKKKPKGMCWDVIPIQQYQKPNGSINKNMEELNYKDLSENELDTLKDMYILSRVNAMTESDLRKFVKEIIVDQIKGTVGNAEEKEAQEEIKDHFSDDLSKKILEVKEKCNKNPKVEQKSQEEIEFDRRLGLLKQQQEEESSKDMW